jgi:amidase
MSLLRRKPLSAATTLLAAAAALIAGDAAAEAPSELARVQNALKTRGCRAIVLERLAAIGSLDRRGGYNAISMLAPDALRDADAIDRRIKAGAVRRALECVPIVVKDNIDVAGLATTAGSIAVAGNVPTRDAEVVRRLRAAGAVVIAKSNMAEWAFTPMHTVSSTVGETANAYSVEHVPAGSSGGTATAVALGFSAAGLGTDTGNSIRGPSAHSDLVGLRPSIGVIPTSGIVPLLAAFDAIGPMAISVRDAAALFDVMAAATSSHGGKAIAAVRAASLKGRRIGVVRESLAGGATDPEVAALLKRAVRQLMAAGAEVVPITARSLTSLLPDTHCNAFAADVRRYFHEARRLEDAVDPVEVHRRGYFAPENGEAYAFFAEGGRSDCPTYARDAARQTARSAVERLMDTGRLDAIAYPSWSRAPAQRARWREDYAGDNSQIVAPVTGMPAITVPMGHLASGLPTGLQFLGRYRGEEDLLALAAGYEDASLNRSPPAAAARK